MPFISTTTTHHQATRELQATLDAATAKRDFWFKIKFGACLLASVFIAAFLGLSLATL